MNRRELMASAHRHAHESVRTLEWEFRPPGSPPYTWRRGEAVVEGEEATCPDCGDRLWDCRRDSSYSCTCQQTARDLAVEAYLEEHRAEALPAMWDAARIPERHRSARLESFLPRQGTEAARVRVEAWAETFDPKTTAGGLYLVGPFGSGKTHLAIGAAARAMRRTLVQPLFVSTPSLFLAVKGGDGVRMRPVEDAIEAELLILDDIGQAGRTEFDREVVYAIVNGRYEANRATLYTSNVSPDNLAERLGGALVSRLHEACELVVLTAADYRREPKAPARTSKEVR